MSGAGDSGVEQLLKAAVEAGAQSLLIKAGDVFRARIDGELVRLSEKPFTAEDTRRIAQQLLPEHDIRENIDQLTDRDFAWHLQNLARFRVNILRQRGTLMVVMRVIPWDIPSVEQLNLPEVLETLADTDSGLILVTGSTGSGKSTTQAAMVGWINRNRKKHIITLEDPIEYRHDDHAGTVTQREVGRDTRSFRTGLRTALRQDPDVILIGEMRDAETLGIAMEAAETGQLVISTFHAATSLGTLSRVMAMFPADDEETVRKRLADALRAVVSQRLILRKEGEGRVPVVEVLRFTGAVQDAVLRGEPPGELRRLMEEGSQYGMQTFDQHLMELVQNDVVAYETAREAATSPSDFELVMQTLADEATGTARPAWTASRGVGPEGRALTPEGVFLPVTSPFEPRSGELDREAFEANVRAWGDGGADGVVVAGSTGEGPLLDEIEILRLTEWARGVLPPGRSVVAGTGLESTRATVRLCREVARNGADAVLVRPPYYYRGAMTPEAVEAHFRAVADGSPVPVLLYNIPKYVPVELAPDLVGRLSRHDNVAGIKDSSGDIRNLGALVEACGGRASVLAGSGSLLYGALEVGAEGGVVAVGLLAVEDCRRIVDAWREGDMERAGAIQERVGSLNRAVVGKLGVPGVKAALDLLEGLAGGPVRGPLRPLDEEGRRRARSALSTAGRLT